MTFVTIKQLAAELHMDRSALIKSVRKLKIHMVSVRSESGHATLAITEARADQVRKFYSWRLN